LVSLLTIGVFPDIPTSAPTTDSSLSQTPETAFDPVTVDSLGALTLTYVGLRKSLSSI